MRDTDEGQVYTATQITTAFLGGDLMTLLPSSMSRIELMDLKLQQLTTAAPLPLTVEIWRGTTSAGAGGATVTPVNVISGMRASTTTVLGPPTAANSTTSAVRAAAGGFGSANGRYDFLPQVPVLAKPQENMHIRTSTVGVSTGTGIFIATHLTFREIGKNPV